MPGHKFGAGFSQNFKKNMTKIDVTEFDETDNLQNPAGIIKNLENDIAKIFGAKSSYILTNGSSIGICAAILSVCDDDDTILVDRNCHKSIINGIILSGANPKFIYPKFENKFGIFGSIDPAEVERAIFKFPGAKAAIITSPTYYGVCSNVKKIAEILHRKNIPLIVDEAHGAHFIFNKKMPKTALSQGADIAIQSAHKTLPCLTQTAMLHVNSDIISEAKIKKNLLLLQSTSPSYLLMCSIDDGLRYATKNAKKFEKIIDFCADLRKTFDENENIFCLKKNNKIFDLDPTKLVFNVSKIAEAGEISHYIRKKFAIMPEMNDFVNIMFLATMCNSTKDIKNLKKALTSTDKIFTNHHAKKQIENNLEPPEIIVEKKPRYAFNLPKKLVEIDEAEGEISAEIIAPCPPGCASLIPGQKITKETINFLKSTTKTERIWTI
jgi:arginine/lysine/ornithine decarboxylase